MTHPDDFRPIERLALMWWPIATSRRGSRLLMHPDILAGLSKGALETLRTHAKRRRIEMAVQPEAEGER